MLLKTLLNCCPSPSWNINNLTKCSTQMLVILDPRLSQVVFHTEISSSVSFTFRVFPKCILRKISFEKLGKWKEKYYLPRELNLISNTEKLLSPRNHRKWGPVEGKCKGSNLSTRTGARGKDHSLISLPCG